MSMQTEKTSRAASVSYNDFKSLLSKEFKPKSEQAKSAVESAVKTLDRKSVV